MPPLPAPAPLLCCMDCIFETEDPETMVQHFVESGHAGFGDLIAAMTPDERAAFTADTLAMIRRTSALAVTGRLAEAGLRRVADDELTDEQRALAARARRTHDAGRTRH